MPSGVERFMEAVGGEQNKVSGGELDDVLVVAGGGEQAGGESAFAERLPGGVEGKWESGVREGQCAGDGIEDGVKPGAEGAGQRTLQQTLVQKREDGAVPMTRAPYEVPCRRRRRDRGR